jgi:hypothetical protein
MAVAKKLYTSLELDWAEKQLLEWREYIENRPLEGLKDRVGTKLTANGGQIPYVISSVEQQGKFIQDTLKNFLSLLKEVENMRAMDEEKKIKARGVENLSPLEDGSV